MIAFCGLICDTCPIHLATLENDPTRQQTMRESIAEICTKQYGMNLHPGDITDCYGCCATSGRLFSGCQNCKIRKCALLKNIESCAFCPEYACPTLLDHFTHEPEAKIRLEEIRKTNKY